MNHKFVHRRQLQFLFLVLLFSAGCVSLAGYDQKAYENATTLKAATLALFDKSVGDDSFSPNEAAVDKLLVDLSAAYEYANGVDHNNEAADNWEDLIGDDENMVKGWIALWRESGKISEFFRNENRPQIVEGFDTIICLEANKRELTKCESLKNSN